MGFEVITSEKFVEIGAPKVAERIKNKVGDNPVYVSVDIDVLDIRTRNLPLIGLPGRTPEEIDRLV